MNNSRILFVRPSFQRHGASKLIVSLAEKLAMYGLDIKILAKKSHQSSCYLPKEPVKSSIVLGSEQPELLGLPIWLTRLIWSTLHSDIIVLSSESGLLWPSLVAKLLRKSIIAVVQNNNQQSLVDYPSHARNRKIRIWAYAQAKFVVCVSNALVTTVEPEVHRKKIISISNGIDIEQIRILSQQPCPSMCVCDDIPFIIGIGRLERQKGFDLLVRAHAKVLTHGIHHRLMLLGEGKEHENLLELADKLKVLDSITFLGFVTNPYPILIQASLFCLSSRYEGLPLTLAEASVLGVPIVATDCMAGPREVLAEGKYGDLVEPESVDALSQAFIKHFQHPHRLLLKAQDSKKRADRLSIQNCAQRYCELFYQCAHNLK